MFLRVRERERERERERNITNIPLIPWNKDSPGHLNTLCPNTALYIGISGHTPASGSDGCDGVIIWVSSASAASSPDSLCGMIKINVNIVYIQCMQNTYTCTYYWYVLIAMYAMKCPPFLSGPPDHSTAETGSSQSQLVAVWNEDRLGEHTHWLVEILQSRTSPCIVRTSAALASSFLCKLCSVHVCICITYIVYTVYNVMYMHMYSCTLYA